MSLRKTLLTLCLLVLVGISAAQNTRLPVYVNSTTNDGVGTALVYALRTQLANSPLYRVGDDEGKDFRMVIVSNSCNGPNDANNRVSAVSITLTIASEQFGNNFPYLLQQWVMSVGRGQTDEMAKRLMAELDSEIERLRKLVK